MRSAPPPRQARTAIEPTEPAADFEAWFAREFPRVRATLTLAVGDPGLAEEAAAEAFARALARWPSLQRGGSPTAWVYTVAMNQVRSWIRRTRLERRYLARQVGRSQEPPGDPEPALWRAVAALPPRTRTAVALRYVADLGEAQVADAMGITRGAVAATLHAARRRLAEELTAGLAVPSATRAVAPSPARLTPRSVGPDPEVELS